MVASDSSENRDDVVAPHDGAVYVRINGRLAQFKRPPTREFWEEHWGELSDDEVSYVLRRSVSMAGQASFIRRHIPARSTVLEAGCGVGLWVRRLRENGINAIGLDYARATLVRSKRVANDLPFVAGDLRNLPFPDGALDVHLSFGVIEHYVDGPGPLLEEALRVLRPGGGLILKAFPGPESDRMRKVLRSRFPGVKEVRPEGKRSGSREFYWVVGGRPTTSRRSRRGRRA